MLMQSPAIMKAIVLCVSAFIVGVYSQYSCVPIGTCPTNPGTAGVPDIRIVTPGSNTCPPGTVPCPTGTNPSTTCGVRTIPVATDVDGTSQPGAFPWQAYMTNQTSQYFGSGALLDQYHILTAAHKVSNNIYTPSNIRVFMGVWDPRSMGTATNRTAVRIIMHPSFNPNTLFNDIAIVRVDSPISLGANPMVGCAALPNAGSSYVGRRCLVSGWGYTSFNPSGYAVGPQKQVSVPVVDYRTCRRAHSSPSSLGGSVDTFLDPAGDICAGGEAFKDACTNDGGAPLVCTDQTTGSWNVIGLVIWGKGCGAQGLYGVYTNVANYRSWIDSTLASLNAG